jgi:glycosyltransferase involved in cell wall biosynthesis
MSKSDVDVIVLCKNEAQHLRACLTGVLSQELCGRVDLTVIDSGSTDGSLEIIRSLPVHLLQIQPDDFHHARTRNLGGRQGSAPVLVYLNGDAVPSGRHWLARLVSRLVDGEECRVAGVYGRQIPRADAYPMERFMLGRLYGGTPRLQVLRSGRPPTLAETLFSTVNCALRRDLWLQRPFSDRVHMSEDQEWSRYWLAHGYAIAYEPEAAVVHSHNNSLSRVFRRYFDSGASSEQSYLPHDAAIEARFAFDGVRYLAEEAAYLARGGDVRWLPYALVYESLKAAGLALGRQHRSLPAPLRRRMTYFG